MVLVEVARKPYLASLVPVIVNAILMEHQIIVDIVAFVNKGDFPRSRLGEKQRGKLLAGWVTRKMRTLAQFAIRDLDPRAMGDVAEEAGVSNRHSMLSARSFGGQAGASSLRNVEQAPRIMEQEEFEQQMDRIADMTPAQEPMGMPDDQQTPTGYQLHDGPPLDVATPQPPPTQQHQHEQQSQHYEPQHRPQEEQQHHHHHQQQGSHDFDLPDFERFGTPAPPPAGPKPGSRSGEGQAPPQIRLPGVDGRENIDFWGNDNDGDGRNSWEADAIMHMNLTGDMGGPRQS